MGTQGPFNEFIFSDSYSTVYTSTNPPPVSGLFINNTSAYSGAWQTIFVVSASSFTALSGSVSIPPGVTIQTGTAIRGRFTDIKLATGQVIAYQGSITF